MINKSWPLHNIISFERFMDHIDFIKHHCFDKEKFSKSKAIKLINKIRSTPAGLKVKKLEHYKCRYCEYYHIGKNYK